MMWLAGPDGRRRFFNRAWLVFTGRTLQEEVGEGWVGGVHAEDRAACLDQAASAIARSEPFTIEYRLRRADGRYRWVLDHGQPWTDSDGAFLGFVGGCIDITERKAQEVAVADAEHRFRRLIENAQDMVYRRRLPSRQVEYVGGAVEAITGHAPAEFYADPDLTLRAVHPDDIALLADIGDTARAKQVVTLRWIHPDGRIVYAEHRRVPVFDASGAVIAIEGIARDITAQIEAYERLRESKDQLRSLAAKVEAAREEERAAVAREIHDELGQTLTALKLEIQRAIPLIRNHGPAIDRLQSMAGLCEWAIHSVQRIATTLRPATLDHLGLPEAIRWEAEEFRVRTGVRCRVAMKTDVTVLTREQQTVVFRVFQEALTNVGRHASASAVTVRIREDDSTFELEIRDNGRGIDLKEASGPRALGLLGMQERAELIGGTFEVTSGPRRGTTITIRVPIRPRAADGT
jgi:two-component system, NarL family, sensor histidine kinase UhpB